MRLLYLAMAVLVIFNLAGIEKAEAAVKHEIGRTPLVLISEPVKDGPANSSDCIWVKSGLVSRLESLGYSLGTDQMCIRDRCSQRYRFFDNEGIPVEKVVEYYLMHEVSGNLKPQLSEVAGVLWVDQEDLSIIRTYSSTMNMLKRFLTAHIQSDLP